MRMTPSLSPPVAISRSNMDDAILATKKPWLGILGLAAIKHSIIALYLSTLALLYITQDAAEKRAGYIYNPNNVALVFFLIGCIHIGSILQIYWTLCCKSKRRRPPPLSKRSSSRQIRPSTADRTQSFSGMSSNYNWIILFNLVEIVSQSNEAIEFAATVADQTITFSSLSLSCLIHLFALLVPLLRYKFVNSNVAKDPAWLTKFLLYIQHNTVSSSVDFAAKTILQLGSVVTLWRLEASLAMTTEISPPSVSTERVRRALVIYLACSVLWGVGLFGSLLQALWIRQPCPPTCQAALMNLWDSTCQCMFVHVNCVQTNSQDVDSALQTSQLGVKLYAIQVSQCDLVDGIANATLHQFPALSYVSIQFTKTKAWDGQLPNSISFFTASDNMFATVPAILDRELPPSLVTMRFTHQPMALPLVLPKTWNVASKLELTNVSFSPATNFSTFSLVALGLAFNNLTQLPTASMASMASLAGVDLSGNALPSVPWNLLAKGVPVLLCGNPLRDANRPELLQTYQTSAAKYCEPLCAPHCFPYMVGNYNCNLACFNAACRYDGGDCHAFELSISSS
ncbi:hypothetical protein Ae201684_013152 [Aphanomyces euteiches]|uniref:LNR domain-containing protein n=1 Tax=Aphanomyces euteiches TaxID=100861 RepID=A0A6G0WP66_9STRA|nr:hypothetical protein Ae201684_013152 [Aphanomyces euteiches]